MSYKDTYNFHPNFKEDVYPYFGNDSEHIKFAICGITYVNKNYYQRRPNSVLCTIEYVFDGEGTVCENGITHNVKKGDFFFLHFGADQIYYTSQENPWQKMFITIDCDTVFVNTLLRLYDIEHKFIFRNVNSPMSLEKIIELIKSNDSDCARELESLLATLIIELAHTSTETSGIHSVMDKAKKYIEKNINSKITVTDLCNFLNISQSYFRTVFKKETGMSPNQYIHTRKIEHSKVLLEQTSMPISEITDMLSFNSIPHFTKIFKNITGETPGEYRKNHIPEKFDWSY